MNSNWQRLKHFPVWRMYATMHPIVILCNILTQVIDEILFQYSAITKVNERKHPGACLAMGIVGFALKFGIMQKVHIG